MIRAYALLAASILLLGAGVSRAEEIVMPAPGTPAAIDCGSSDCEQAPSQSCLQRFKEWFCYKPLEKSCCCKRCAPRTPPIFAFFPCDDCCAYQHSTCAEPYMHSTGCGCNR